MRAVSIFQGPELLSQRVGVQDPAPTRKTPFSTPSCPCPTATRPTQACLTDSLPCSLSRPRAIVAPSNVSSWQASHFAKKGTGSATSGCTDDSAHKNSSWWFRATIKRCLSRACSTAGRLILCYIFLRRPQLLTSRGPSFCVVPADIIAVPPAIIFLLPSFLTCCIAPPVELPSSQSSPNRSR